MIVIPAIDLREGACVQLVGGEYAQERIRRPDPLAVAQDFARAGFTRLHTVDLDAATGKGDNLPTLKALLGAATAATQVGGGVRSLERAQALVAAGAARVVVGTRAILEPDFLQTLAQALPGRVVLAADVRGREVVTQGWASGSGLTLEALLARVAGLPLAGVLVTGVHVEGQQLGADLALYRGLKALVPGELIASGGIGGPEDLRALAAEGVDAVVVGMALYTGRLDAAATAREFSR